MTASERRRPVTARDFNRLLFALLLLAALTVLARLITRQESKAEMQPEEHASLAQWVQTADALFVRGEWHMAAEAYYGAIEAAAASDQRLEPRMRKKLALCLAQSGDSRGAMHYLKLYRLQLLQWQNQPSFHDLPPLDSLRDPTALAGEVAEVESLIQKWGASGS